MQTPWAIILCKFTDGDAEPHTMQYYQDLFTSSTDTNWNLVRYFKEYSHGTLDLSGSKVFGWYQLDKSVQDYNNLGQDARAALIGWARAIAIADGIDLSPFFNTVVCTNLWHDIGASSAGVVSQGVETQIQQLLAHEMSHIYGLNHSRMDGSTEDYKDPWDVMSVANYTYSAPDDEFALIGPGLNASNMRSRGWLDETRTWTSGAEGTDETITLRPLDRHDLDGFLAAELPNGHLVEFRVRKRWDGAIPRAAVLIHRFADGASYLIPGNAGVPDLVAGDSFGDPEPGDGNIGSFFSGLMRLDVVSIDEPADEATIRIRHRPAHRLMYESVDPMALILSGRAYLIWVELRHPHEPKVRDVQAALRDLPIEERRAVLGRAQALKHYGAVVEEALRELDGS